MTSDVLKEIGTGDDIANPAPVGASWWARYAAFGLSSLSRTAREVVECDSRLIVRRCIPPPAERARWPETRIRTGIVVGAVQSGKTASMLAVSALLLDSRVDVVAILAGTRIALWRQTYARTLAQLDGTTPETAAERWSSRVLVPHPIAALQSEARSTPAAYMAAAGPKLEQALRERRPVLLVIPKIEAHLLATARELHARVERVLERSPREIHLVVMDDEADDASVLDAADSKTIPRRVEMLWSNKAQGQTAHESLFATYVAYTATPQANFLQQSHNPLSPRSFNAALRTPYRSGGGVDSSRTPTFAEPDGLTRYYCGGETFYNEFPSSNPGAFCQTTVYPTRADATDEVAHGRQVRAASDEMLQEGLRAYLVAGGIRFMEAQRAGLLLPSKLKAPLRGSELKRLPPPHCMLVHPSARQDVHLDEARRLVALSQGRDPDLRGSAMLAGVPAELGLDAATLAADLEGNPTRWRVWLGRYRATAQALTMWPGAGDLASPGEQDWEEVSQLIRDELLPHVRLRIINSDPLSDDRPRFEAERIGDDTFASPPDLLTIFVSGNVMSRGITIEGLCTTVFTRPAAEPAADTQMQMQRWFGYRGRHLHLCRLFAFHDQAELFRTYHEHDMAMRREILAGMDREEFDSPNMVLQGPRSLATAKVPTSRLPLHPGPTPSIKLIEADNREIASGNADILAKLLQAGEWVPIGPAGRPRGSLCSAPIPLESVATVLDGFRYASYDPAVLDDARYRRWRSLEDQLQLLPAERPLFRPPARLATTIEVGPNSCPYSVAAYLRLWAAALRRPRCDGLYPSDSEGTPWAVAQPLLRAPSFYVGVAYGEGDLSSWPQLAVHGIRTMTRGEAPGSPRILNTLWGRRTEGGEFYGDQLFDYNFTGLVPPRLLGGSPIWRERGHPGLILFHVIRPGDATMDAVTMGLAIPHGGPEQFAALPALGRGH